MTDTARAVVSVLPQAPIQFSERSTDTKVWAVPNPAPGKTKYGYALVTLIQQPLEGKALKSQLLSHRLSHSFIIFVFLAQNIFCPPQVVTPSR